MCKYTENKKNHKRCFVTKFKQFRNLTSETDRESNGRACKRKSVCKYIVDYRKEKQTKLSININIIGLLERSKKLSYLKQIEHIIYIDCLRVESQNTHVKRMKQTPRIKYRNEKTMSTT